MQLPPVLVLALAALLSFGVARAHAQDEGPPPEYRGIVDSALEEFDAQHWAEARALFERAHAIFPNARTLRGMGMAAFELRDYVAARRALEASLTESRRALTDEQRAQVSELVTRARVFVGDFRVGPAPAHSELYVDGVPTTPDGDITTHASVALAVGAHEVLLRSPDGRSAHAQITVHGGENAELALTLPEPGVASDPTPTGGAAALPSDERPAPAQGSDPGLVPWVMVIGGGVVAVVGAILLGVGASDAATVSNAPRLTEWADLQAQYDRSSALEGTGIAALVVGALVAGAGAVWLAMSAGPSRTVAGIGPGSLVLRGTF